MKEQQELVHMPKGELARQDSLGFGGVNVQALIEKSIDSKSAVEVLERLMALRNQVKAENAKAAYDRALAAFQSECPIIVKRKAGAQNAYRYAPLDHIIGQVKDLLKSHSFSYTLTSDIADGWVKAICTVKHDGGHSEPSEFKCPIDGKNPMMTAPQRYGGAMTFAKRYAFCNAFGILTADEDKDAAPAPARPKGPKVATEATRQWMLAQTKDIHVQMQQYAIDKAIIMPNQGLEDWPLAEVPTSKEGLAALRKEVEAHQ